MNAGRTPQGDLSFMLGQIQAGQEIIQQTLSEDRLASAQYRTEVRKELKEHGERMQKMETQLSGVISDVGEIKPKVSSLDERATMSKGAANLAIALGKFAHVITAGIGGLVVLLLDRYVFGKHP